MNLHPIMELQQCKSCNSHLNRIIQLESDANSQYSRRETIEVNHVLAEIHDILEASICKTLSLTLGSTIGVRCICTYAYFYWCTHDFGHVYVDTYTHFFSMIL